MNLIKKIFETIISILLPKSKEVLYLESLSPSELLEKIAPARSMEKDRFLAIFDYRDPLARSLIKQIKYKANQKISENIATLLYDIILEEISDEITFSKYKNIFLVPIPCSEKRLREKGFNQTEILTKEIIKIDKNNTFKFDKEILVKTKDTPHQVNVKNRQKRLHNLENSFGVKNTTEIKNCCAIVIDDVITTGATMTEAKKTLKQNGAKKVICVALAH